MLRHILCISLVIGTAFAQDSEGEDLTALIDSLFVTPEIATAVETTITPKSTPTIPNPITKPPPTSTSSNVISEARPPGIPTENICPGGECVAYYQCSNGNFITDGEGLIDIRFSDDDPKQCANYLETCCGANNITLEPIPPPIVQKEGCGNRYVKGIGVSITDKGSEAKYGEFPWMVALLKEERANDQILNVYQCGGTLIHPNVVVTAAHCVYEKDPRIFKIRAGEWDTQTKTEAWPHQDRQVAQIIVHEQFYKGGLYNDIALLFFEEPVKIAPNVQPACLPPQDFKFDGNLCAASGWGKDVFGREGKYQVILKKIELSVVPRAPCQDSLRRTRLGRRFNLHNSFICAGGEPGKDTCKGDGGSPLVCPIPRTVDRYYQAGIVAWGIGCGENQVPGVYVNVALFKNWIDGHMNVKNLDRSYYTP